MQNLTHQLDQVDWDFPHSNKADTIHSIHPYPAKFISEIPRTLIATIGVPQDTWILDPFCGSGATLVESQTAGIPSVGIDLNPIACLISSVKTRPLSQDFVSYATDIVMRARWIQREVSIPAIPNLDHWFRNDVQQAIARLLLEIDEVEAGEIKDALRLTVSSILVRVSNQDSDTRYAAIQKNISGDEVYKIFLSATERLWAAKTEYRPKTWDTKIINKDLLTVSEDDIDKPVGLVITSPPYPNAYEYWLYHKYRMFWLGYDPLEVRQYEIGARAHYFKKNYPTEEDFRSQMRYLLNLLWAVVVRDGHVCIVIGRSKIHGEVIDNASIISDVAIDVGFQSVANLSRRIASARKSFNLSHANIKTEQLLVFRK